MTQGSGATPAGFAEAKAWLRIETSAEDAVLAALIRTATGICEAFTGLTLIARDVEEVLPAARAWTRLTLTPVSAITAVAGLPAEGASFALPVGDYAIDIDARGDGFVRVSNPGAAGRVRVSYRVGIGESWNALPEPIRQGITRLAGHLFDTRSGGAGDSEPPAAVTALWQPYRRMRLQ